MLKLAPVHAVGCLGNWGSNGIEHRLTSPPLSPRGQVARMNLTTKDATFKRFHCDSRDQLREHLANFPEA